ncbi:hypothetical protein [Streptomyces sp. NPDC002580]|uniref:hypothetical protein n=1 Tax=Streptomyces sp. NPDC002580 TaxID=3364653 RepID=UPI0036BF3C62
MPGRQIGAPRARRTSDGPADAGRRRGAGHAHPGSFEQGPAALSSITTALPSPVLRRAVLPTRSRCFTTPLCGSV